MCYALAIAGHDNTAAFLDDYQAATGYSSAPAVSLTTDAANAAIFTIASSESSDPAAGSGFTGVTLTNYWVYSNGEYDLNVGTAGAKSADFTIIEDNDWAVLGMAVKSAGGGGSVVPIIMQQH